MRKYALVPYWRRNDEHEGRRGRARAERESRDDRSLGWGRSREGCEEDEERVGARLRHVTLFYSFFGPVVALMSPHTLSVGATDPRHGLTLLRVPRNCVRRAQVAIYEATALERTEVREPFIPRQHPLGEERCKTYVMKHLRFRIM